MQAAQQGLAHAAAQAKVGGLIGDGGDTAVADQYASQPATAQMPVVSGFSSQVVTTGSDVAATLSSSALWRSSSNSSGGGSRCSSSGGASAMHASGALPKAGLGIGGPTSLPRVPTSAGMLPAIPKPPRMLSNTGARTSTLLRSSSHGSSSSNTSGLPGLAAAKLPGVQGTAGAAHDAAAAVASRIVARLDALITPGLPQLPSSCSSSRSQSAAGGSSSGGASTASCSGSNCYLTSNGAAPLQLGQVHQARVFVTQHMSDPGGCPAADTSISTAVANCVYGALSDGGVPCANRATVAEEEGVASGHHTEAAAYAQRWKVPRVVQAASRHSEVERV